MTNLEAIKALARKLNINYSTISNNDTFSLEDLQDWVNQGAMQAYDYEFWDFAEHSKTAILQIVDVSNGHIPYPNDIQASSIYYVQVNGKEHKKRNFTSWKKIFEDAPTSQEKVWAEFKRLMFFNPNLIAVDTVIDIYGKRNYRTLSGDTDLLPFSPDTDNEEMSGNQAIIYLAYAEALSSEKKKNPQQGEIERKKGYAILDVIKNQLKQGRATEQSQNRPMFNVGDMFGKGGGSSEVGTFNTN